MKNIQKRIRTIHERMQIHWHPFFRESNATHPDFRQYKFLINNCTMISEEHKFIYCRVPKAANSTVMATLVYAQTGFKSDDYHAMKDMRAKCFSRITESNISREGARRDYFKLSIVRHPFSRIISTFNDKALDVSRYNEIVRGRIKPYVNDARDVCDIFEEFLAKLEHTDITIRNYHYAPQTKIMAFHPSELDYIGRVESLDTDLPYIMHRIFGASPPVIEWSPHAASNGFKPRERKMRVEMLSQRQKDRLYNVYRDDFDFLGYERDL